MKSHTEELGIREDQIIIGGESARGGLFAALAMMARDKGEVRIAYQMPLYLMIDNFDTESSRNNHGRIWNTKKEPFCMENVPERRWRKCGTIGNGVLCAASDCLELFTRKARTGL